MITLGGSLTTTRPPAWNSLSNPEKVAEQYDLNALARYYNYTLTQLGTGQFSNVSLLLHTFRFTNTPTEVNQTALLANGDIMSMNASIPKAIAHFYGAELAIKAREYLNASQLVSTGCREAAKVNKSFTDFTAIQTPKLASFSVPVSVYGPGSHLTAVEVNAVMVQCRVLHAQLPSSALVLEISSPQTSTETGGTLDLNGTLTSSGGGISGQEVLFYINGTYFGTLTTDSGGKLRGTLRIPFLYKPVAFVQAVTAPNPQAGLGGGGHSNELKFQIMFNATKIVIGDPPAYLPTQTFTVEGNLTTLGGVPLPDAPVKITFFNSSTTTATDSRGIFTAGLTVPAEAKDGVYNVNATFAPQGVYGPSFNFTSIRVIHLPLVLHLTTPSLSFAGFSTEVSGTARSNGSTVAGAQVNAHTPWGDFEVVTNGSGHFRVRFPISPLYFAFNADVQVLADPIQPYISTGSTIAILGLLNPLLILLPAMGLGLTLYQADKLDAFGRVGRRASQEEAIFEETEEGETLQALAQTRPLSKLPELIQSYRRALELASQKFGVRFRESLTMRECIWALRVVGATEGTEPFSRILLAAEDFFYSKEFDESRLVSMREDLKTLERVWK